MKNILLLASILLFAATLATPVAARPSREDGNHGLAPATAIDLVPLRDIRHIKLGMTREQVLSSMRGKPDEMPTAEVWIYWNFQGNHRPANMEKPAMLVFFTGRQVSDIRYSEEQLVRNTLAQHRQAPPHAAVAAK